MMKKFTYIAVLAGAIMLAFSGCEKATTEDPPEPQFGDFKVEFDAVWAASMLPFDMNTKLFHPKTGDSLTFTTFKFYVSNIKLKKADGTLWEDEESYYLVDLSDPSAVVFDFINVPAGTYTGMYLTMGVDSARNVSGAQEGALDPANGMFWSWTSGYIMIKAEGLSPQGAGGSFTYHLGGFSGPDNVVMEKDINFPSAGPMTVSPNATPTVHMVINPARLFHSYGSVANGSVIMSPGPDAATMAFTFNDWVRLDHIHP
jgi:hypothetical protein